MILGTATYGKLTESRFNTYDELDYIISESKPFFLVKMCDQFEEKKATFHFTKSVLHFPWPVKDHSTLPRDLVSDIKTKLQKLEHPLGRRAS